MHTNLNYSNQPLVDVADTEVSPKWRYCSTTVIPYTMTTSPQATEVGQAGNSPDENHHPTNKERLGKKLAYLLRYGAKKEGLSVSETGYVNLSELMTVDLLKNSTAAEVISAVKASESRISRKKRFEMKSQNGDVYVRAAYKRNFEPNPYHDGTQVYRLIELCLKHICKNIADYSLEDFPDEFLVRGIIHRMKREKKLSNTALENIIGPGLELLDLEGAFLTEKTLNIVKRQGCNLKNLSLRGAGYLLTDHNFIPLIKKLPNLETLDISGCSHLTSVSFTSIPPRLPNIRRLLMSNVDELTEDDVVMFLNKCQNLKYLQVYGIDRLRTNGVKKKLLAAGKEKGIYIAFDDR